MYKPLTETVSSETTREERIEHLVQYFCRFLCEDGGPDGTSFDCAVLDVLRSVEKQFPERKQKVKR